jgi:hypothetical protein
LKRLTVLVPIAVLLGLLWAYGAARMRQGARETPIFDEPHVLAQAPMGSPFGERVLRGRVVDIEGRAMAGVTLYFRSNDVPFSGKSDAEGRFSFEGLGEHEIDLAVLAWGHPPRMHRVAPGEDVEIVITPPLEPPPPLAGFTSASVSGRVSNPLGRRWWDPDGYEVALIPRGSPAELGGAVERRVRCAPTGEFTIPDLVHGSYDVHVLPEWAAGSDWPDLVAPVSSRLEHAPGSQRSIAITLRCGVLEGTLSEPNGRRLEGAVVLLSPAAAPARLWPPIATDAEGRFRFLDLPPGAYLLSARAGEGALIDHPVHVENAQLSRPELPSIEVRKR